MRKWALTIVFGLVSFVSFQARANEFLDNVGKTYLNARNGLAAEMGGADSCVVVSEHDLDQLQCKTYSQVYGRIVDFRAYTKLAEKLVLTDLTLNAEASIDCHLPFFRKYVTGMQAGKPDVNSASLTSRAIAKITDKIGPLTSAVKAVDELEARPPGAYGEHPSSVDIKEFNEKLSRLRGIRDALLADVPLGNVESVREEIYKAARSGKTDAGNLTSAFVKGVSNLRDEMSAFKRELVTAKAKDKNHDYYDFKKMPALRQELMMSDGYDSEFKSVGATAPVYRKMMCRRDAEFKTGPGRLAAGATGLSILALAASFGSSAIGEAALGGVAELVSADAQVAIQIGMPIAQLSFGSASAIAECTKKTSIIAKAPANCSEQDAFDGIIARANSKQCYADIAQTALLTALSAPGVFAKVGEAGAGAVDSIKAAKAEKALTTEKAALARDAQPLPKNSQIEIWKLDEAGDHAGALALRDAVKFHLQNAKVATSGTSRTVVVSGKRVTQKIDGNYGARFVEFEDGTRGIWKPMKSRTASGRREIGVADVDEALGSNLVPVTVPRKLGNKEGTIQLFVEETNKHVKPETVPEDLRWFDSLIYNSDRHAGNSLKYEGRSVAIDHGHSLNSEGKQFGHRANLNFNEDVSALIDQTAHARTLKIPKVDPPPVKNELLEPVLHNLRTQVRNAEVRNRLRTVNLLPPKAVYERLKATPPAQWRQILEKSGTDNLEIEHFITRRGEMIRTVEKAKQFWGDSVLREGSVSPTFLKENPPISSNLQQVLELSDADLFTTLSAEKQSAVAARYMSQVLAKKKP